MLVFLESDYDNFPLVSTEQITITFTVQLDIVFRFVSSERRASLPHTRRAKK